MFTFDLGNPYYASVLLPYQLWFNIYGIWSGKREFYGFREYLEFGNLHWYIDYDMSTRLAYSKSPIRPCQFA